MYKTRPYRIIIIIITIIVVNYYYCMSACVIQIINRTRHEMETIKK